jgi:NAD(P)-dependent dehydrogenase (short-subunit alcohol dehydrogenase family)
MIYDALIKKIRKTQSYCQQRYVFVLLPIADRATSITAGFTYDKMLHTLPDDAWDIMMKIHVRAPFRLIRAAAPHMRKKGENSVNRSIVNVSSTSGLHGNVGMLLNPNLNDTRSQPFHRPSKLRRSQIGRHRAQ